MSSLLSFEVAQCICTRWLSPERLVKPDQREHMTWMRRKEVHSSDFFSQPFFQKDCEFFVETILRFHHAPVSCCPVRCHQLLPFQKQLWLKRSISSGKETIYECFLTYRRVEPEVLCTKWEDVNDKDHPSCFEPDVVFTTPKGQSDIVNMAPMHFWL